MLSSDVMRGYNDTIVLYILRTNDSYGYEIGQKIQELSNRKYIIKETTLYSTFARLDKNGYIKSYSGGDETKGRQRTYYHITDLGNQYYLEKCVEWNLVKEIIDIFTQNQEDTL
ncbi:PadR family transcriptional regulator [Erysipelothrix piscisicarius]|uniref:PadR family transcriptional regulator n=1 Tax=Erysipelothrix piscisicarius TaxID=2485784 RepID=UPI002F9580E8